jgi:hypothetical protein
MLEAAKALLLRNLKQELSLRDKQADYLLEMAEQLPQQGLHAMTQTMWEMWRHNEVDRIKLKAQIEALSC